MHPKSESLEKGVIYNRDTTLDIIRKLIFNGKMSEGEKKITCYAATTSLGTGWLWKCAIRWQTHIPRRLPCVRMADPPDVSLSSVPLALAWGTGEYDDVAVGGAPGEDTSLAVDALEDCGAASTPVPRGTAGTTGTVDSGASRVDRAGVSITASASVAAPSPTPALVPAAPTGTTVDGLLVAPAVSPVEVSVLEVAVVDGVGGAIAALLSAPSHARTPDASTGGRAVAFSAELDAVGRVGRPTVPCVAFKTNRSESRSITGI